MFRTEPAAGRLKMETERKKHLSLCLKFIVCQFVTGIIAYFIVVGFRVMAGHTNVVILVWFQ